MKKQKRHKGVYFKLKKKKNKNCKTIVDPTLNKKDAFIKSYTDKARKDSNFSSIKNIK